MKKPITLHIPKYYTTEKKVHSQLIFSKEKPLLDGDGKFCHYIASIESVKNYKSNIVQLSDKYNTRATNLFYKEVEGNYELPINVSGCKVYSYSCDDESYHFRYYWIVLSSDYMLQLVGVFDSVQSGFYKNHFMTYFQYIEINTTFDYNKVDYPEQLFDTKFIQIDTKELKERIEQQKAKEEHQKFLEKNLTENNPHFYKILSQELKENEEVEIENFICKDWNLYYNLYNPENFSDPDEEKEFEWQGNDDVYEYYENPYTDNKKINIRLDDNVSNLAQLKNLIKNSAFAQQQLLDFFENYTFNNGGSYAEGKYFTYARKEIERFHKTTYTNQEFLKRNLCLDHISIKENELELYFHCSWDEEHGVLIAMDKKFKCWQTDM